MKLLIIDGNYLCWQAWYAMPELRHGGQPTSVVFGFLTRVLALANEWKSNRFVFCFDEGASLRKKIDPEYKANRKLDKDPEKRAAALAVHQQIERLRREVLPAMGIGRVLSQKGLEGDDLIAIVAKRFADKEEIVIVSGDEDLYQLLYLPGAVMYNPSKKSVMTARDFEQKYGIEPLLWPSVKVLAGCPGDNVKGVYGVGEKTALAWLKKELPHCKKRNAIAEALKTPGWKDRQLALVRLPLPNHPPVDFAKTKPVDIDAIMNEMEKHGIKTLADRRAWEQIFVDGNFASSFHMRVAERAPVRHQMKKFLEEGNDGDGQRLDD